jgi:uncharacterized protein YbaA (DUF1428 family)
MRYVDGYVLPVPKKNLEAYRRIAQKARKVWAITAPLSIGNASATTSM